MIEGGHALGDLRTIAAASACGTRAVVGVRVLGLSYIKTCSPLFPNRSRFSNTAHVHTNLVSIQTAEKQADKTILPMRRHFALIDSRVQLEIMHGGKFSDRALLIARSIMHPSILANQLHDDDGHRHVQRGVVRHHQSQYIQILHCFMPMLQRLRRGIVS